MQGNKYSIMLSGLSSDQVDRVERRMITDSDEVPGIKAVSYDRQYGRVSIETYRTDIHEDAELSFYNAMAIINEEIRK